MLVKLQFVISTLKNIMAQNTKIRSQFLELNYLLISLSVTYSYMLTFLRKSKRNPMENFITTEKPFWRNYAHSKCISCDKLKDVNGETYYLYLKIISTVMRTVFLLVDAYRSWFRIKCIRSLL